MRFWDRLHAYHRFWRYRLRTERREIALMLSQDFGDSTVLDVGANRGAYSYWMHQSVGPRGNVVAFEPQPELSQYLAEVKKSFKLPQLTIANTALSDRPGTLSLVRPKTHWGGSSFHLDPSEPDCDVLEVPVTTLDQYVSNHDLPPVRFIKCDVQDHEAQVFRGATSTLLRDRPLLLIEQTEPCMQDGSLGEHLSELGYRGYFFYRDELVSVAALPKLRDQIKAPFLNYVYRVECSGSRAMAA